MEVIFEIKAGDHRFNDYWQLVEVEFSQRIPWLSDIKKDDIYCHIFLDNSLVVGGVSVFRQSPECENIKLAKEKLLGHNGVYASCFLLDQAIRGKGSGKDIFAVALKEIFRREGTFVWGVVTSARLLRYYQSNFRADVHATDIPSIYLIKFLRPC